jgi:hypothetical protein
MSCTFVPAGHPSGRQSSANWVGLFSQVVTKVRIDADDPMSGIN